MFKCACVRVCVRVCVCLRVRACACVCVCVWCGAVRSHKAALTVSRDVRDVRACSVRVQWARATRTPAIAGADRFAAVGLAAPFLIGVDRVQCVQVLSIKHAEGRWVRVVANHALVGDALLGYPLRPFARQLA